MRKGALIPSCVLPTGSCFLFLQLCSSALLMWLSDLWENQNQHTHTEPVQGALEETHLTLTLAGAAGDLGSCHPCDMEPHQQHLWMSWTQQAHPRRLRLCCRLQARYRSTPSGLLWVTAALTASLARSWWNHWARTQGYHDNVRGSREDQHWRQWGLTDTDLCLNKLLSSKLAKSGSRAKVSSFPSRFLWTQFGTEHWKLQRRLFSQRFF